MKRITRIESAKTLTIPKKKRVVAYARVSTSAEDQLLSLEVQKKHYEGFIKSNSDWDYAGLYYDEGVSGTKAKNRTGIQNLLQDSEDGKIDMIITKSISRFARNATECLEMVRRLVELGVVVVFEKENIDTSKMENEFLLTVLSSMAETESRSLSQNCKWAAKKRFENGTFIIGYPPYGYKNVNGEMVVVEEEAEVVRRIFKEALNGSGMSLIAKGLQKDGIATRRRSKWNSSTINDMLRNEKYTGDSCFQKTFTDDDFTRHSNHGEENMYLIQNHHEPIVSHEDFNKVQGILSQRGLEKGNNAEEGKYQERYAFSGKIKCGECGSTFKRRKHYLPSGNYIAWSCSSHIEDRKTCKMLYVTDRALKNAFITLMEKLADTRKTLLKPFIDDLKCINDKGLLKRVETIGENLERNLEQQRNLINLMTAGILEPAVFTKENNQLVAEAEMLKTEKNQIASGVNNHLKQATEAENLMRFISRDVKEEFDENAFREFIEGIVIVTRTVALFRFKCGLELEERLED